MTPQELSPKERQFYEAKIVVHALEMALIGPAMHEHMLRCELTPDEIKRANDAFMKSILSLAPSPKPAFQPASTPLAYP